MPKIKKTKEEHEKQKETQRQAMRRLREKIKNDPAAYEESKKKERERYYTRKKEGKIKSVCELSEREKRVLRKKWNSHSHAYYKRQKERRLLAEAQQKLMEESPPTTPTPEDQPDPRSGPSSISRDDARKKRGKQRRRKHLKKLRAEIKSLKKTVKILESKKDKYRMKWKRAKRTTPEDSPTENVNVLLQDQHVTPIVRKKLMFSEVISKQLAVNYRSLKSNQEKRIFWKTISGRIVKKYKKEHVLKKITTSNLRRKKSIQRQHLYNKVKDEVTKFFEQDESSRLCPGKNDFLKKKGIKRQKRLLNDTLRNLHKKLVKTGIHISYATFCRFKPFWIVHPQVKDRDTCMCVTHTNISLIIRKLKINGIIRASNTTEFCQELCCLSEDGILAEKCLERSCEKCKRKKIVPVVYFEPHDTLFYEKWCTKRVNIVVKGTEKTCLKTVKEKIPTTKEALLNCLNESANSFLLHIRNIVHQYTQIKKIKENLGSNDCLIHLDFSENYSCKYAEEVQSAHFGGSKEQLSLHTVVVYFKGPSTYYVQSFCTVSKNLRHDAAAICAHLVPVLKEAEKIVGKIENIHFLSDGPTTQYRNRKMFYLNATFLQGLVNFKSMRWHYSEKGHGKGAPDGVGGTIKRTADNIVALGNDLSNFESFVSALQKNCPKIKIVGLTLDNDILEIEKNLPPVLPNLRGIMQCHEITWSRRNPKSMDVRKLTCLECPPDSKCDHYTLDAYQLDSQLHIKPKLNFYEIYSDSSDDDQPLSRYGKQILMDETFSENKENLPSCTNSGIIQPEVNDYVMVKFSSKKSVKHFVGVVQQKEQTDGDYLISFMRKMMDSEKFTFPSMEDISFVNQCDILMNLPSPAINNRGQYSFSINLSVFSNLG